MNTPSRNAIRSVRCPHCDAPANEPCVGTRGNIRDAHHAERVTEAARNAAGPERRGYDRTPTRCSACDDTGLVIVSEELEPDPMHSARGNISKLVTRYGPCPRCHPAAAAV